jgi:hypothetical protein
MGTLTAQEGVVLGRKLQLPPGKELDLLVCDNRGTLTILEFKYDRSPRSAVTQLFNYASSLAQLDQDEFFDLTDHKSLIEAAKKCLKPLKPETTHRIQQQVIDRYLHVLEAGNRNLRVPGARLVRRRQMMK